MKEKEIREKLNKGEIISIEKHTTMLMVVEHLIHLFPEYERFDFYYHANIVDDFTKEIQFPEEFVGVSTWHDGYFDTSEDPDGWSLQDEVIKYEIITNKIKDGVIPVSILLEDW